MMTYVLGLTGGIASGKSTVSAYLHELGAEIIDADLIARQVVAPESEGLKQIKETFGLEMIKSTGELDRARLGALVFDKPELLAKLTAITGPLVNKEILRQLKDAREKKVKLVVLDIPLLFETGYDKYCNQVMVITIPPALQIQRLMLRNDLTKVEAKKRLASQMSQSKRDKLADVLIDNSKSVEETYQQVLKWLKIEGLN